MAEEKSEKKMKKEEKAEERAKKSEKKTEKKEAKKEQKESKAEKKPKVKEPTKKEEKTSDKTKEKKPEKPKPENKEGKKAEKPKSETKKKKTKKKRRKKSKKSEKIILARGKRKRAIARVRIRPGSGSLRLNSKSIELVQNEFIREIIREPLRYVDADTGKIDISVNVRGGGEMGQAQAARTAIANALADYFSELDLRKKFMEIDRSLIVEDTRRVESKKYKGPKARARYQKSYR